MDCELKHYGIKGMHWGIRRFQPYPDGSGKGKFVGKKRVAKKLLRTTNKNSRMATLRSYYANESGKRYAQYEARAAKAEAKGKTKKYDKLMSKANKEMSEMKENQRMAAAANKAVNDAIKKLKNNGFDTRATTRTMNLEQKAGYRIVARYAHYRLGKDKTKLDKLNDKMINAEDKIYDKLHNSNGVDKEGFTFSYKKRMQKEMEQAAAKRKAEYEAYRNDIKNKKWTDYHESEKDYLYSPSEKQKAISDSKKDRYNLDFLETIQNDYFLGDSHPDNAKIRQTEYKKFLDNPRRYMSTHEAIEERPKKRR